MNHFAGDRPALVILGTGTSLRFAPFDDPGCTFWGASYLWGKVPRLDVGFMVYPEPIVRELGFWEPLATIPIPVYMIDAFPACPTAQRYPLEVVAAAFTVPAREKPFLTNTVSEMIALALLQDPAPTSISFFGVDMTQGTEYEEQRPSCEFFVGVCHGRGIPLFIHPVSDLLKTQFLYGYEEAARAAHVRDLHEREAWFSVQRDVAIRDMQAALTRLVHHTAVVADVAHHMKRATL